MNAQSENISAIESDTLSLRKDCRVEGVQSGECNHSSEQTPAKIEQAVASHENYSIGTLHFGAAYRATSPKTYELTTRYAAIYTTVASGLELEVKPQC